MKDYLFVIGYVFIGFALLMLTATISGRPEVKRQQEIKDQVFNSRVESVYVKRASEFAESQYKRKWESYPYKGVK